MPARAEDIGVSVLDPAECPGVPAVEENVGLLWHRRAIGF